MRLPFTIAAFLATLVVVTAVGFIVVIVLAGPHAGILPQPLEVAVTILGWLSILVLPLVVGMGRLAAPQPDETV